MIALYCSMLMSEQEKNKMVEIYEEHKLALLKYAITIAKNQDMAEDAVHNAFLSIIKHKEKYFSLDSRDFRSSAIIIVRNKCIDLLRKQMSFDERPFEEIEIYLESGDTPVDEQAIFLSEYESIKRCLNSIDEISRQVLIMKYSLGMSYKEIGEALGMTPKHIDTRIMRAKEKVRKMIKAGGMKHES